MPAFPRSPNQVTMVRTPKNPSLRHYNPRNGSKAKRWKDHLRFQRANWHTMRGTGSDPFGTRHMLRLGERNDSLDNAKNRVRVAFEFIEKLGAPSSASTTGDVGPRGQIARRSNKNLDDR